MNDSDTDVVSGSDYEGSLIAQDGRVLAQRDVVQQTTRVTPECAAKSRQSVNLMDSGQGMSAERSGAPDLCSQLEVVWPQALFSLAHSLQTEERLSLAGSSQGREPGSADVRISLQKQGENIRCFLEASGAQLVHVVGDRWHCSVSNIGSPGVSAEQGKANCPKSTSDLTELQIKQEQDDLSDDGGLVDETLSNEESNNMFNSVPDNDMDDMSDKGDGEVQCQTCDFTSSRSQDLYEHIAKSHSTLDNYQDVLLQSESQIYESKISNHVITSSVVVTCPFPYCQTQRCGKAIFHHMAWCHKEFEPDYLQVFNETRAHYEASLVFEANGLAEDEATMTTSEGRRVLSKTRTRPKKVAKRMHPAAAAKNKQVEKTKIESADGSSHILCPVCGLQPKRNRDILQHFLKRHHTVAGFREMLYELETEFYLKGFVSAGNSPIPMHCPYCSRERLGRAIFLHLRWCHRNFEADYNNVYSNLEEKYNINTRNGVPLPRPMKLKPNTKQVPRSKNNQLKQELSDSDAEADETDDNQDNEDEKDEDYVPISLTPRSKPKRDKVYTDLETKYGILTTKVSVPLPHLTEFEPYIKQVPRSKTDQLKQELSDSNSEADADDDNQHNKDEKDEEYVPVDMTPRRKQKKDSVYEIKGMACSVCGLMPSRSRSIVEHIHKQHRDLDNYQDLLYEFEEAYYQLSIENHTYVQVMTTCPFCDRVRCAKNIFRHLKWCHRYLPDFHKVFIEVQRDYDRREKIAKRKDQTQSNCVRRKVEKAGVESKLLGNGNNSDCNPGNTDESNSMGESQDLKSSDSPTRSRDIQLKQELSDSDAEADENDDNQDNADEKDEDYVPVNLTPRRKRKQDSSVTPKKREPTGNEITNLTCPECGHKPSRSNEVVRHMHRKHKDLANYQDLLYEFEEAYYQMSIVKHYYVKVMNNCPYCDRVRGGNNIFRHLKWCHRYLPDFQQVFTEVQRDYDERAKIAVNKKVRKKKARVEAGIPKLLGKRINSDCNPMRTDENNSMDENQDSTTSKQTTKNSPSNLSTKRSTKRNPQDRSVVDVKDLTCPYCNEVFFSLLILNKHVHNSCARNPELGPWLMCRFCSWRTRKQDLMETHIKEHKDKYVCEFCGKQFIYKAQCYWHKRKIHGIGKPIKKVTCSICNVEYPNPRSYKYHMKRWHNDEQYTCEHCGKAFNQLDRLKDHQRKIHFNDFKYRCPKCNYGLHKKSGLRTHVCGKTRKRTRNLDIAPVIRSFDKSLLSVQVEGWQIQKLPAIKDRQDNTVIYPLNKGEFFRELATGTKDVASDPGSQGQTSSQDDDPINPAQDANQERAIQDQTNTETTNQNTIQEQIETQQAIQKISPAGLQSRETDDDIPIVSMPRSRIPSHQAVVVMDQAQAHDLRIQGQGHFSQEGDSSNQLSHDQDSQDHMTQAQSSQGQGHMMLEGPFTQGQIARAQASGYIWGQPEGHIWPQPDFAGRWHQHPNFFS